MGRAWYVIQTYTGYENAITRQVNEYLEDGTLSKDIVFQVKAPTTEGTVKSKNGKVRTKTEFILPGYVMLEMDLPQIGWKDTCTKIRRIRGVTGFVGTKPAERPREISADEAKRMFQLSGELKGEKSIAIKISYAKGDQVKIIEGPFASMVGTVAEVLPDKNKLRVNVQVFGRETPVEIDALQVEKV